MEKILSVIVISTGANRRRGVFIPLRFSRNDAKTAKMSVQSLWITF